MAVFGWGLQYKVSLYHGHEAASHEIPVAKLLSQKERATPTESAVTPPGSSVQPPQQVVVFLLSVFSLCLLAELEARYWEISRRRIWSLRPQIPIRVFSLRPPPSLS